MISLFSEGRNKALNEKIKRIKMNCENNYKDAAQSNLKEYEAMLNELTAQGKLKGKQLSYYQKQLSDFQVSMNKYTHKDQKPKW